MFLMLGPPQAAPQETTDAAKMNKPMSVYFFITIFPKDCDGPITNIMLTNQRYAKTTPKYKILFLPRKTSTFPHIF
jgi:hypothetical protein